MYDILPMPAEQLNYCRYYMTNMTNAIEHVRHSTARHGAAASFLAS